MYYTGDDRKALFSLHTEYAFLSVNERQLPEGFARCGITAAEFQSDKSGTRQPRFYTRLTFEEGLSDEQYLNLLSDLKREHKDAIIAPYFQSQYNKIIGLFYFFYVKLKEENT